VTATLYGIGVGPGDPDLITLKGLRVLEAAPVIAYPAPESGDSLARAIMAPHLDGHHEEIAIRMPMTSDRFPAAAAYDRAARRIGERLDAGLDVAVLCEGDPFFYGSFMFLFGRMADRYPVEVVPGVSSLTACASALDAPLAARNDVLSVVPATLDAASLERRIREVDAVAIIKVGRHFAKVRTVLERLGARTRARYVERATMVNERILRLEDVDPGSVPYFSMILVHARGEAWRV